MNKSILIIEDNDDIRENIAEILDLAGYNTATAENGKAGILKARKSPPDLILCDIMMPELDGYGVLKILRDDPKLKYTPFIFLTAKTEKDDFRKGMGLGADDYIVKPFDDVQLLEAIETRLDRNQVSYNDNKSFINEKVIDELYESLLKSAETRILKKKEVLIQEGSHPNRIYYLESGLLKNTKRTKDGREFTLNLFGDGEFIGQSHVLNNMDYDFSCEALETSTVKIVQADKWMETIVNHRDSLLYIMAKQYKHLIHKDQQLVTQSYASVSGKTAAALLYVLEITGKDAIDLSREDLSNIAGVAKETLTRMLSDFKNENIITVEHKQIKNINIEALKKMLV